MSLLAQFAKLPIDWNLTPEHAVTMYLEWGNNNWNAEYPPVRSKDDFSIYFVVDTWGRQPVARLVRRNSTEAVDLATLELPEDLVEVWKSEYQDLRGIFAPLPQIQDWLKKQLEGGC